jgi:hypothetical protein
MPIIGWLVNDTLYSFDEAEKIATDAGHFDRFSYSAIKAMRSQDRKETRLVLSPSTAGGCPRNRLLKMSVDYYVDPESMWKMFVGTAIHKALESGEDLEETKLETILSVPYTDASGVTLWVQTIMAGSIDKYTKHSKTLTDYKTTNKPFMVYDKQTNTKKARELPEPNHVIQTNLYRFMLELAGYPVEKIQIWYVQPGGVAARKMVNVPVWSLEDTYLEAIKLAIPLVTAMQTGELPPCTCVYKSNTYPDLCNDPEIVAGWQPAHLTAVLATNSL